MEHKFITKLEVNIKSRSKKVDLGVDVDISNPCTEWTGHTTKDGYRDVYLTLPNGEKYTLRPIRLHKCFIKN